MTVVPREFPFPTDVTRRERLTFSKHAGMQLQALASMLANGNLNDLTVEAEVALLLIAAQRVDPSITFNDCLDHDDWVLAAPPPQGDDAGPLDKKPETTPDGNESTNSPT